MPRNKIKRHPTPNFCSADTPKHPDCS